MSRKGHDHLQLYFKSAILCIKQCRLLKQFARLPKQVIFQQNNWFLNVDIWYYNRNICWFSLIYCMFSFVSFLKEWIFECHGNLSSVPKPVSNGRKLPVILTSAKPEGDIPKLSFWLASNVLELINCTDIVNVISVSGPDCCLWFLPMWGSNSFLSTTAFFYAN